MAKMLFQYMPVMLEWIQDPTLLVQFADKFFSLHTFLVIKLKLFSYLVMRF